MHCTILVRSFSHDRVHVCARFFSEIDVIPVMAGTLLQWSLQENASVSYTNFLASYMVIFPLHSCSDLSPQTRIVMVLMARACRLTW